MRGWKILRRRVGRRSEQSSSLVVVGSLHKTSACRFLVIPIFRALALEAMSINGQGGRPDSSAGYASAAPVHALITAVGTGYWRR